MPLRPQASYSGGELDPALQERTTFDKYSSGLATARGVMVGKTGRIMSRMGRKKFLKTKNSNQKCVLYSPTGTGLAIEVGPLYVRVYSIDEDLVGSPEGTLLGEYVHTIIEADLNKIHFDSSAHYIYMICAGYVPLKLVPTGVTAGFFANGFMVTDSLGNALTAPTLPTTPVTVTGSAGYPVDYLVTKVCNGQESPGVEILYNGTTIASKLPIAGGQANNISVYTNSTGPTGLITDGKDTPTEIRVYRRPQYGGAYGYVGNSTSFIIRDSDGDSVIDKYGFQFVDYGADADFTHQPPIFNFNPLFSSDTYPSTCCIYQQRLLLANYPLNKEAIEASRTGYSGNFTRDFPLSDDSALTFKAGSSGHARVLRIIESEGLVAFTSTGVFRQTGALTPDNLALQEKGSWIIDENLPPLKVPGGVMFFDKKTNTVRSLTISETGETYNADEVSIFSDHLFSGRTITSWCYHDGVTPVIFATFSDGTFASFTFEDSQEMRAWTRHDSKNINIEQVCGTGLAEKTLFLVEKDGERYVEMTVPRYVEASLIVENPEAVMNESYAYMDSMVSWSNCLNDSLVGTDKMVLATTEVDVDGNPDWSALLTLTCGTSALFPIAGIGAVGSILRYFDPDDHTSIDLVVTAHVSDNQVTVQPSDTFPSANANLNPRVYQTKSVVTGLDHMEGEAVSIVADGYVAASPFNDHDNYDQVVVTGGQITLPADVGGGTGKAAIIHVGRPIIADVETLDIASVEQRPVLIESQTVDRLYIKTYKSRGLYAGNTFVDGDLIKGSDASKEMVDVEQLDTNSNFVADGEEADADLLGNKYIEPQTTRYEVTIPGDWRSHGRICLRQVDPLHFEILSIIADTQDLRRSE